MMIPIGSYIVGMGWSHQPVADLVLWQAASAGEHLQCCCPQRSNLLTPGVRSHDSRTWRSHVIPLLLLGWWISQHGPFWQHLSCIDCGWNDWAKVQTWQGKKFKGGPMGGLGNATPIMASGQNSKPTEFRWRSIASFDCPHLAGALPHCLLLNLPIHMALSEKKVPHSIH